MRKLAILVFIGLALCLVACGESTTLTNPTAAPTGPFSFEGEWAGTDDDGAQIHLDVVEDSPGGYSLTLSVRSASGETAGNFFEDGIVMGQDLVWMNEMSLRYAQSSDQLLLEVEKPGAQVKPLVVTRSSPAPRTPQTTSPSSGATSASPAASAPPASEEDQIETYLAEIKRLTRSG